MMLRRLLPKKTDFFDFFDRHIELTVQGCHELLELARSGGENIEARAARIKEIEHATDRITHECIEALHETFITPIERGDIHRLIKRLDDIIDAVDAAVLRIRLYDIKVLREEVEMAAELLVKATSEIGSALRLMRSTDNIQAVKACCVTIFGYENEADTVLRKALARLFNDEPNPITVIKWKEIFEILELASDRCEDVANIIQGIMIEAS
jgi:predicted phosphate transport protein (TIGR00153 family)